MTSLSDQELSRTETLLRQRLAQLADHAPTAVHLPDEVPVLSAPRHTGRARRAGVITTITALIGAGGFTTYSFLGAGNDGGAATPEEAVTAFVSAIEHEDVLGMIDVTLPEEVGQLRAAVESATADAKRIDLLADDFDIGGVQGIDVTAEDLVLDTNVLEGGLAVVSATGGTLSAVFDSNVFPFGDKLRQFLGDSEQIDTSTWSLAESDPPALLMAVQRDGRWYVSLEYTVAEYVRQAAGWELPDPVTRTPVGFDSAEAAATGFYERLASLDAQAALDTFAPGEDAIAWIAQSWITDVQAAFERGRTEGWTVGISGLSYVSTGSGDRVTLKPVTFKVEGTVPQHETTAANPNVPTIVAAFDGSEFALLPPGEMPATIDGLNFTDSFPAAEDANFTTANADGSINQLVFPSAQTAGPQPFSFERADGCTTIISPVGAYSPFGGFSAFGTSPVATKVDGGYRVCGSNELMGGLGLFGLIALSGGGFTELPAISVVQTGGKWYVSPLGTLLASVSSGLHDAEADSSLFDSPLAPFLYGGLNRSTLESFVVGQPADSVDESCLPALTVDNGTITGVVADPPLDAVWACMSFDSSSSGSGVEAPAPVVASTTP